MIAYLFAPLRWMFVLVSVPLVLVGLLLLWLAVRLGGPAVAEGIREGLDRMVERRQIRRKVNP